MEVAQQTQLHHSTGNIMLFGIFFIVHLFFIFLLEQYCPKQCLVFKHKRQLDLSQSVSLVTGFFRHSGLEWLSSYRPRPNSPISPLRYEKLSDVKYSRPAKDHQRSSKHSSNCPPSTFNGGKRVVSEPPPGLDTTFCSLPKKIKITSVLSSVPSSNSLILTSLQITNFKGF